jgi:thiamine monophosphate synthase
MPHIVLQDELVDDVDRIGRVVCVVLDDQVDLAAEHPAVGVHVVEIRL